MNKARPPREDHHLFSGLEKCLWRWDTAGGTFSFAHASGRERAPPLLQASRTVVLGDWGPVDIGNISDDQFPRGDPDCGPLPRMPKNM